MTTGTGRPGLKKRPRPSKAERQRKIKALQADFEAKKRALGMRAPSFRRGPVFYLALMGVLTLLGLSLIRTSEKGGSSGKVLTGRIIQASKSVDAFAEALGRYKFHTGVYPTAEDGGLEALASKTSRRAGWMGPYIHKIVWADPLPRDPWKHAYVYAPEGGTNGLPVLLSCGPDGVRGTADDIVPDPARFTKPFRDTSWTNDWAPYQLRGIRVVPRRAQGGENERRRGTK